LPSQPLCSHPEHACYPILLRLVLSFGAGAGWVRHRTHSILPVIALHVCLDMSLFIAAIALSS
jgi:membrane protease YdiL (CAAX protease family)